MINTLVIFLNKKNNNNNNHPKEFSSMQIPKEFNVLNSLATKKKVSSTSAMISLMLISSEPRLLLHHDLRK